MDEKFFNLSKFYKIGEFFMPFCTHCGQFSIQLDTRNHCQPCSDAHFEGMINEKDINGVKIKIEKKLRYKMLNYIDDIELKPLVIGSNIPNMVQDQRQITIGNNLVEHTYRKSTIALFLSLLGFILLIDPMLGIFSLLFELIGLYLAISSRRTEPPNWRRKIAISVSLIYVILFMISIIILLMNPELVEQMIADLEAQSV